MKQLSVNMNLTAFSILCYFSALDKLAIKDIIKFKNIGNVVIFNCFDSKKSLIFQKDFINQGIRVIDSHQDNSDFCFLCPYSKLGVIVDTSCSNWFERLSSFDKVFFKPRRTWIIKTTDPRSIKEKLMKLPLDVDSDVIILTTNNQTKKYMIYEVFNTGFFTNGSFIFRKIGHWSSNLYLTQNRRTDLSGVVLKSAIVIVEPVEHETYEQYLEFTSPPSVDALHKLKFYRLLTYLRQMYNYSYEFRRTNSWGYLRNGSFDGMTGALGRKEVDIGGSAMFIRADRAKFVDYVVEVWQTRLRFILRDPKHLGYYSIYTRPFTSTVWYSIIAAIVLIGVTLFCMLQLKALRLPSDDLDSSMSLVIVFVISALCQQGTTCNRRATCIKIVFFATSLFFLILYQYYNGTVVSTLLHEPPRTIKSLADLLKSNLDAGAEDVLYNKDYFMRTTDPVAIELYKKKIVKGSQTNFFDAEYGMSLVKNGRFAFHVDCSTAYRFMRKSFTEREICEVQEIRLFPPQFLAAALIKESPYKEHVAIGVRKMYESGIMYRLRSIWDEPKPLCVHTPDSSIFTVSIREISMALAILALGVILAAIILIGEILVFNLYRKRHFSFVL